MTLDDCPFPRHEAVAPPPPPDARWLHTPVRAFMRPGVVTVSEDASVLQVQRAMIAPTASAADALQALDHPAVTHLIVSARADAPPQGVVSEIDLVRLASAA